MGRRRSFPLVPLTAVLLIVAACGSDGASAPAASRDGGPPSTAGPPAVDPGTSTPDTSTSTSTVESVVQVDAAEVGTEAGGAVLVVRGVLPTPCHRPEHAVEHVDGRLAVRLVSLVDADVFCAQVVSPFELAVPLGPVPATPTPVTLNGRPVGTAG